MTDNGQELYKKYRPTKFSELVGQDEAVQMLTELGKRNAIPHACLLVGPSGSGKTTSARILRVKLGCSDFDYVELNSADFRGIDTIRDIRQRMGLSPIGGKCRVYVLDECQQLSSASGEAMLKLLEDTPSHVYFILCTTDPQKLKATIRTRCTEVKFKSLTQPDATKLVRNIAEKEGIKIDDDVVKKIVDLGEGSARKLLVLLHAISGLMDTEDQLAALHATEFGSQAFDLARLLLKPGAKFSEASTIIKQLEDDPEQVRWIVLGYAKSVLLGGGKLSPQAYAVIQAFRDNFYDSKVAGLTAACYEVFSK